MENLLIDFNNHSKSKIRIIGGLSMIILSFVNIFLFDKGREGSVFDILHTLNIVFLFLVGIFHFLGGMGKKFNDLIGERFIKIDEKEIVFKYNYLQKATRIEWDNIQSVLVKFTSLEFMKNDNSKEIINIAKLDYKQSKEIKEYLRSISKKYKIEEANVVT